MCSGGGAMQGCGNQTKRELHFRFREEWDGGRGEEGGPVWRQDCSQPTQTGSLVSGGIEAPRLSQADTEGGGANNSPKEIPRADEEAGGEEATSGLRESPRVISEVVLVRPHLAMEVEEEGEVNTHLPSLLGENGQSPLPMRAPEPPPEAVGEAAGSENRLLRSQTRSRGRGRSVARRG